MKKKTTYLFLGFVIVAIILTIHHAHAMDLSTYQPLEPLPDEHGVISYDAVAVNSFFTRVYFFSLTAAVFLSVIMIIAGGLQYMARGVSESAAKGAKDRIQKALLGLVLALGSYLILQTINPELVHPQFFVPAQEGQQLTIGGSSIDRGVPGSAVLPVVKPYAGTDPSGDLARILADEQRVRTQLENGGVVVTGTQGTAPCTQIGQEGCTLVGTLPQYGITDLLKLKGDCECKVIVTAGTEWWGHQTHQPDKAIVDLDDSGSLTEYLAKTDPLPTTDSHGNKVYTIPQIGRFVAEIGAEGGSHYHVFLAL